MAWNPFSIFRPVVPQLSEAPEPAGQVTLADPVAIRLDAWANPMTGAGTARDKRIYAGQTPLVPLPIQTCKTLYYSDAIAAKIVDDVVKDSLRNGYTGPSDSALKVAKRVGFDQQLSRLAKFGRALGGAVMYLGTSRGAPDTPLPKKGALGDSLQFVQVIERPYVDVWSRVTDPYAVDYGAPLFYVLGPPGGSRTIVHRSRVLRWDGVETDLETQNYLAGWSLSVFQRLWETLRDFAGTTGAISSLLLDASQAVVLIQGLNQMVASNNGLWETRARMMDMQRGAGRALFLDAEKEKFERVASQLSGISDLAEILMGLVSAAADEPQTKLFGRSPAGMNATGESDNLQWDQRCQDFQRDEVKPVIETFYRLVQGEDVEIAFPPLRAPTRKELAELNKMRAETINVLRQAEAISPEEGALEYFDPDAPLSERVDIEARRRMVAEGYDPEAMQEAKAAEQAAAAPPGKPGAPEPPEDAEEEPEEEPAE